MATVTDLTFDAVRVATEFHAKIASLVGRQVQEHEQGSISATAEVKSMSIAGPTPAFLRVNATVPRRAPHPPVSAVVYLCVSGGSPFSFEGIFFLDQANTSVREACAREIMKALLLKLDTMNVCAPSADAKDVAAFERVMLTITTGVVH